MAADGILPKFLQQVSMNKAYTYDLISYVINNYSQ